MAYQLLRPQVKDTYIKFEWRHLILIKFSCDRKHQSVFCSFRISGNIYPMDILFQELSHHIETSFYFFRTINKQYDENSNNVERSTSKLVSQKVPKVQEVPKRNCKASHYQSPTLIDVSTRHYPPFSIASTATFYNPHYTFYNDYYNYNPAIYWTNSKSNDVRVILDLNTTR